MAGMFDFNADDVAGSVEVEHDIRSDFVRTNLRAILKLNVQSVCIGVVFESHAHNLTVPFSNTRARC